LTSFFPFAAIACPERSDGMIFASNQPRAQRSDNFYAAERYCPPNPKKGKRFMPVKAMILAAGKGTRLRPLTDHTPKALIAINGTPILEIVLSRVIQAGVREVVINTHHLAEQVVDFLKRHHNFGIHIEISYESELLDTGGALKKVASFFNDQESFFLHNVDVLTTLNLKEMMEAHQQRNNLATLFCGGRESTRCFLFDETGQLCGWRSMLDGKTLWAGEARDPVRPLPFNGIHVMSPRIFPLILEEGSFSINQTYLRLAGAGESIKCHTPQGVFWRDIGRLANLEQINNEVREKKISF
jgi:NDP-sugar pyrophosphorylase family protein